MSLCMVPPGDNLSIREIIRKKIAKPINIVGHSPCLLLAAIETVDRNGDTSNKVRDQ